jgi:hypothetical protein
VQRIKSSPPADRIRAGADCGSRALSGEDRVRPYHRPAASRALKAFEEFFFGRARDVYPKYDFAPMNDDEYGAVLALE